MKHLTSLALLALAAPVASQSLPLGRLPLTFEANRGQASPELDVLARGRGFALGVGAEGALFAVAGGGALRVELEGARPAPAEATGPLPGRVSYLIGNDPAAWVSGAPTFARVVRRDVLPGVDQVFYDAGGELEFDLVLAPGVDPAGVVLRYGGAERLELDADGDLLVHAGGAVLEQRAPVSYQEFGQARVPVESAYELRGSGRVGFAVGAHDPARPLVIDPVVAHATALGGNGSTQPEGVHVGGDGAIYVGGSTNSSDLPTVSAFQPSFAGAGTSDDFWFAKLTDEGTTLEYLTYLGGSGLDRAEGFAVTSDGAAVLAGFTDSTDFPLASPFQAAAGGLGDGAVAKLAPTGDALVFSTYLGGFGLDGILDAAVDATGDVYVTGRTSASDLPVTAGAFQTVKSFGSDAFVARFTAAGGLVYSTYFGAGQSSFFDNQDEGNAIALDGQQAWIVGQTDSPNLPLFGAALSSDDPDSRDLFVARFGPTGFPDFVSYLGGTGPEDAANAALAVEPGGDAVLVAETDSLDFPTTSGALEEQAAPLPQAIVARVDLEEPQALEFSTFLGDETTGADGFAVAFDPDGSVWVGGRANDGFPLVDEIVPQTGPSKEAFLVKLAADGSALSFSTFLGHSLLPVSTVLAIAPAAGGDVVVAVETSSSLFAGTLPDASIGSSTDLVLARIDLDCDPPQSYGAGTAGTGSVVPEIEADGQPRIGNDQFAIEGTGFVGGAVVVQVLGLGQTALPVAGITLLVDPTQQLFFTPSLADGAAGEAGEGSVTVATPVPNSPALAGLELDAQHVSLDPGGPQGFAASHGLTFEICDAL